MGTRKNYRSLTDGERDRLVRALFQLKSRGIVDQFARLHSDQFSNGIHRTSHFLPWHREFILRFENELRIIDPDITLPYWDSSIDRSPSDPLWQSPFLGQFDGPWRLNRALGSATLPSMQQVQINQGRRTYSTFWPELERDIHNPPHNWVSGVMASAASPGDPAFFFHHCWIDLLWARWQRANPGLPFEAGPATFGVNDPMAAWPDRTPAHVLNHHSLGYRYDVEPGSAWNSYQLADPGTAAPAGGIAVVSRIPNSMELWWITTNGAIQGAHWYEGPSARWNSYELAPAGTAAPAGGIAVVSRIPNSMELWWITTNGAIQGAHWYEGPSARWNSYELAPAGTAAPAGGIAVVSRIPNSMELWWITTNGAIQGAHWYEGPSARWNSYELAPAGTAAPAGGIAVVSRIPNSMELWWITTNGAIQGAHWYEGPSARWNSYELAPAGTAAPAGGIAVVSRIPNSMELWWITNNGAIQGAHWYEGPSARWNSYELAPAGTAAPAGGIAVVSRIPNSMELWWITNNGAIQGAHWYQGGNWNSYPLAPAGTATPEGGIAVVSRIPNSMELWWITNNGAIQGAHWYET